MKPITKLIAITFLLCFAIGVLGTTTYAEIPHQMTYQGKLVDKDGNPIDQQTVSVTFRIYDSLSKTIEQALWSEVRSVTPKKGAFTIGLGEVTPINLAFNVQYYLGLQVGTDPEMTPRLKLASTAYAFRAQDSDTVSNFSVSATPSANKLVPLDANAKLPLGIVPANCQLFTSSGVFTAPVGITKVFITMVGGGGGGGGGCDAGDNHKGGGGGGGGQAYIKYPYIVTAGNSYTATIGTGGIGGSHGNPASSGVDGGSSTFDVLIAYGGKGGKGGDDSSLGIGGGRLVYNNTGGGWEARDADPNGSSSAAGGGGIPGGNGQNGGKSDSRGSGGGGGSAFGKGGDGTPNANGAGTIGGNGSGWGAGGGGGTAPRSGYGSGGNGGTGSAGFVLVEW